MRRWIIGTVLIVALLGGASFLVFPRSTSSRAAAETIDNPAAASPAAASSQVEAEGRLVPERSAVLSLPIDGTVSQVLVAESERVEAGQLLARLDTSRQSAAIAQAEAGLRRAQASLDALTAGPRPPEIAAAQATVAGAEARAELAETKYGNNSQQARIAGAEVRRSAAELALTEAGERSETLAAAAEAVTAARSALEQAQRGMADTELRAPFPGTIAKLDLRAGETVAATSPVGSLADFSVWQVETDNLPEQSVVRVQLGAAATIRFAAVPGPELSGRVVQVKPIGENKQGEIVYTAVIRLDRYDERLRWNMTASVTIRTQLAAASFAWPDYLPDGMALAVEDSWPFRALAPARDAEPFLVFRDAQRWILIRHADGDTAAELPGSTTRSISIGGASVQLSRATGDSFTLMMELADRPVRVSGAGVGDDEIIQIAESLRPLSAKQLEAKLTWEAARHDLHLTLLWPTTVPDGLQLDATASSQQPVQLANNQAIDSYVVTFRGADSMLQLGGNVEPPALDGTTERVADGPLRGKMTVVPGKILLVVDGGGAPHYWSANSSAKSLPPVQHGSIFVLAENVDRATFDTFVSGLAAVQPAEFNARLRGQSLSSLTYFWPSRLPDGYRIDRQASQASSYDRILHGDPALFSLTASGRDGSTVTIKGGRESNGGPFIVPEGSDVERFTATIHGRSASVARTAAGTVVVWTESGGTYAISSPELALEQLLQIGEALQPLGLAEFNRRLW